MAQAAVGMKTATFEFLDKNGLFADLLLQKLEHQKLTGMVQPLENILPAEKR